MPRLLCETHGRMDEVKTARDQERYRETGECVLVVSGRLISGPWYCDRCDQELTVGNTAYLVTALPGWIAEGMTDYDFAYERQYFAMTPSDKAVVYGYEWPDDSIRNRRDEDF